jgi:hypothetical protein
MCALLVTAGSLLQQEGNGMAVTCACSLNVACRLSNQQQHRVDQRICAKKQRCLQQHCGSGSAGH